MPVRVWVPGCATGEEAYSVAILLHERAATLEDPPEIQVFATDIDQQALFFRAPWGVPVSVRNNVFLDWNGLRADPCRVP